MSSEKHINVGTLTCRIKVQTPKYITKIDQYGITNYEKLDYLPKINSVELKGNKTTADLGIVIPAKTSDLTNDSGFITSSYHDSTKYDASNPNGYITKDVNNLNNYTLTSSLSAVATSGSYNDLTNAPTIPEKISDLTDDTATNPVDKADTLTDLTAAVTELNHSSGVTTNIQTQLDNKSNINADNFSATGKSTLSGYAMPSGRIVTLTVGASGATYTAPANGWFIYESTTYATSNAWYYLRNTINMMCCFSEATAAGIQTTGFVPCRGNDVIELAYFGGASVGNLKFIYAEGES